MTKPSVITSYDLIKTFAVIIMIVDHIGYYFYPDELWWRAVGRIGFPVWFFLVGYARGRDLPIRLVGGAFLLLLANIAFGIPVFPLNALFTIILLRLLIDSLAEPLKSRPQMIWPWLATLTVLIVPTDIFTEYGTQALMFALFGYLVRHAGTLPYAKAGRRKFMMAVGLIFTGYQGLVFSFAPMQFAFMAMGTLSVCVFLLSFEARTYPALDGRLPEFIRGFLQFCGRRTLEIYVAHLLLFKAVIYFSGQSTYTPFSFLLLKPVT